MAGRSSAQAMATPKQIRIIPAQRVLLSCSPKNNFAPNAPATYASDVAGITKLTGNHESIARNAKNDNRHQQDGEPEPAYAQCAHHECNNRARAEIVDFAQQLHRVGQADFSACACDHDENQDGGGAHVRTLYLSRFPAGLCAGECG